MEKKTVMLTITEQCNLDCSYCYENNSDYLQKARKYGHFTGYKN